MTSRNDAGAILSGAETVYPVAGSGGQAGQMAATAKEQAGQVAGTARGQAGAVAGTARDQAGAVAGSATDSARRVAGEATTQVRELTEQTRRQLSRAGRTAAAEAGRERSLAGPGAVRYGSGPEGSDGIAGDLVREASQRAQQVAEYLDERNPGDLVDELRGLGRRRPGAFLTGAVLTGLLVGRFAKGGAKASQSQTSEGSSETGAADQDAPVTTTPPRSVEPPYLPARATEGEAGGWGGQGGPGTALSATGTTGGAVRADARHRAATRRRRSPVGRGEPMSEQSVGDRQVIELPPEAARSAVTQVSVGQLVSEVTSDLSKLMRQEVELAKAEVKEEASRAGKSAGLLGGAGAAGYFALLFASLAIMFGLAVVMHTAWAALIVAAVYGVVGVRPVQPGPGRPQDLVAGPHPDRGDLEGGCPVGKDPRQIRQEIERTRAELGTDLDLLNEKVNPARVMGRRVSATRTAVTGLRERVMGSAAETGSTASDRLPGWHRAPATWRRRCPGASPPRRTWRAARRRAIPSPPG